MRYVILVMSKRVLIDWLQKTRLFLRHVMAQTTQSPLLPIDYKPIEEKHIIPLK